MAKSIDIRKVALPDCEYYESVEDTFAITFIGRLKGITELGHQTLLESKPFCRLLRTLVKTIQRGKAPDKVALCAAFKLPARVYNTARKAAEAAIASAIECQKVDLENVEHEINREVVEAFWGRAQELHGRVRKLKRLYRKRNRLLKQQGQPHIHFGRKFYQRQEEAGWKPAYEAARNDRIGCLGSSDENGGNTTYQIKAVSEDGKLRFELYHSRKLMAHFTLKPQQRDELEAILAINRRPFEYSEEECMQGPRKGQKVLRKVTAERVPLTVWLIRHENGHWYIHISFIRNKLQPDDLPVGAIGVDLNCDSIADTKIRMDDGAPLILKHQKRVFDPAWSGKEKEAWIYEQINEIVLDAKASRCMVVLEYLDFEHCKRWLRTKLGAMLRAMPYRTIRKAFERRCMERGVILRYVKSHYTSTLGAILADYPNLGRDQAAAAIVGLRALEPGNAWLEQKSREIAVQEKARLRINRKGRFGCTVTTDGVWIDRQSEALPSLDRETDTHQFQNRAAREISGLSKAMGAYFFKENVLPVCWKRSGPKSDLWHPVVPEGDGAPCPRTSCSSLSN